MDNFSFKRLLKMDNIMTVLIDDFHDLQNSSHDSGYRLTMDRIVNYVNECYRMIPLDVINYVENKLMDLRVHENFKTTEIKAIDDALTILFIHREELLS